MAKRKLVLAADDDGRKLAFFYEPLESLDRPLSSRQKVFELSLYGNDLKWRKGIANLIGDIVLGALNLYPPQTEQEILDASRRNLAMIAKLEEEERKGLWDDSSLKTRAELEFVEYSRTGDLEHFLKGEALYRRLAESGSQAHAEMMKSWDSERERRLRRAWDHDAE